MSPGIIIALFLIGGLVIGISLTFELNPVIAFLAVAFNWISWFVGTVILCVMGMSGRSPGASLLRPSSSTSSSPSSS